MERTLIYTDGSCLPNPGRGAWSIVVVAGDGAPFTLTGAEPRTTNNEMELTAIMRAMEWLSRNGSPPATIHSDSQYALNAVSRWAVGWEARGWTKKGGPIKNLSLIKSMLALSRTLSIRWQWVRGHNGDRWNELADTLAENARAEGGLS